MTYYDFDSIHIQNEVLAFMHAHDIYPAEDLLIHIDGSLHRFKTREDKAGDTSGAYCIFIDEWPAGWVQDWRKGDAITWSLKRDNLDEKAKSFWDDAKYNEALKKSLERQKLLQAQRVNEQALTSEKARVYFAQLPIEIDPDFPYVSRKKIIPTGVKFVHRYSTDEAMIIPLLDINGHFLSFQSITADGDKKFFYGAPTKAAFFTFGSLNNNSSIILVGEGYATMATVYQLTGYPCVASMNCGNLLPVCTALKEKYTKAKIIIMADNDHLTERNPGISAAQKVQQQLSIQGFIAPEFADDDKGTDWNDYYITHGVDHTAKLIHDKISFVSMPQRIQDIFARVQLINAQDLKLKTFPPTKWAVDGFLPAGCALLAGGPKQGKSILALHLCLGIATGGCVLGKIFVEQGDVLYLALEDTQRRLQERILGSDLPDNADLSRLTLVTDVPRQHEGGLEFIEWWIVNNHNPRLVIIDTLQKFRKQLSGKGDRYAEDYDVISAIKRLGDKYNVPILIIHHQKKAQEDDWVNQVSGTNGLSGAADTIFVLMRARTQGMAILHRTGRDVEEKDFAMHLDRFGWVLDGDAEQFTMPEWKKQILDYLRDHGEVSPKDLSLTIDIPMNTAQQNLRRLAKEGLIEKVGYGTYRLADK